MVLRLAQVLVHGVNWSEAVGVGGTAARKRDGGGRGEKQRGEQVRDGDKNGGERGEKRVSRGIRGEG